MTKDQLREYLEIVVDLEKHIYLQKQLLEKITRALDELLIPKSIHDPMKPKLQEIRRPAPLEEVEGSSGLGCGFLPTMIFSCIAGLFIAMAVSSIFGEGDGTLPLILMFAPPAVVLIRWIKEARTDAAAAEERYRAKDKEFTEYKIACDKADAKYKRDMEWYMQQLRRNQEERQQDERDRALKRAVLQQERERVEANLKESEYRLSAVYEKGVIFPKYRNLVMVCSLYEYLCTGRCETLEGHEGGYNILETEIRLDRIVSQLDKVIMKLDQIRDMQYTICAAVKDVGRRVGSLMDGISRMSSQIAQMQDMQALQGEALADQIMKIQSGQAAQLAELQKTSELTAYHAERTQKELAYMNRMNYLTGRNDGPFFNQPPS